MYWEDTKNPEEFVVPDDVVDVVFGISCRCLPVDHAFALSQALTAVLPWLGGEGGIHPVLVAGSGNGWMRPENPNDLLYPSRRTKLALRVPQARVRDAEQLSGKILDVAGHSLRVEKSTIKRLSAITTVFSHFVVAPEGDEQRFMQAVAGELAGFGVRPKKMLCGKETIINAAGEFVRTRSLMLADLAVEESVLLQQRGLGPLRHLGCGLFIPHKDINEVKQKLD